MDQTSRTRQTQRGVRLTAASMVVVVSAMVGLVVASEPLYKLFCQVTGYGGTPRIADKGSSGVASEMMTVRFDSNVNRDLAWKFRPAVAQVNVQIGEETLAFYEAKNMSDETLVGTATFNVMPERVAPYFNKIECFCFTEQVLKPGETVQMPVTFFIDPDMLKDQYARDIKTVTLSYTFFLNQDQSKAKTAAATQANYSN
jgi:cytochrome c oxidase assembly protein subunit 11